MKPPVYYTLMQDQNRHNAPQWYPGHMAKARRMLLENLKLIDLVIEVLDARIPASSQNPDLQALFESKTRLFVLAKSDLASPQRTREWIARFATEGHIAIPFDAHEKKDAGRVTEAVSLAARPILERFAAKGVKKTVRAMVAGIPNAGKSTLINRLARGKPAAVGNKPGVTRGKQWVKAGPYLELLDTPGLLWPRLERREVALNIAWVGSIRDEVMDAEALAAGLLEKLYALAPDALHAAYGEREGMDGEALLYAIARRRNWMQKAGVEDTARVARAVIDEFRSGRLGRITLEFAREG